MVEEQDNSKCMVPIQLGRAVLWIISYLCKDVQEFLDLDKQVMAGVTSSFPGISSYILNDGTTSFFEYFSRITHLPPLKPPQFAHQYYGKTFIHCNKTLTHSIDYLLPGERGNYELVTDFPYLQPYLY